MSSSLDHAEAPTMVISRAPLDDYRGRHWMPRPERFRVPTGYSPRHAAPEVGLR